MENIKCWMASRSISAASIALSIPSPDATVNGNLLPARPLQLENPAREPRRRPSLRLRRLGRRRGARAGFSNWSGRAGNKFPFTVASGEGIDKAILAADIDRLAIQHFIFSILHHAATADHCCILVDHSHFEVQYLPRVSA